MKKKLLSNAVWILIATLLGGMLVWQSLRAQEAGGQAREWVKEGALLVDVRSPEEFAGGHIPGAINIPVDDVDARLSEFGPKDKKVVVYCRSGGRSAHAAKVLEAAGYAAVLNLGPMSAW